MKKYSVHILVGASILVLLFIVLRNLPSRSDANTIEYTLNNQKVRLLVADTPEEREVGLMNRRELKEADGMMFIFEQKAYHSFWNKNTLMDLDVYWIDDKTVVGKSLLPSIEKSKSLVTIDSPKPVNVVIEVPRK